MGAGGTHIVHKARGLDTSVCDAHVHALLILTFHFPLSGANWGAIHKNQSAPVETPCSHSGKSNKRQIDMLHCPGHGDC